MSAILCAGLLSGVTVPTAVARSGASVTVPRIYVAHVRVHINTTSDWTTFTMSPGFVTASRLSDRHGSGTWQAQTNALVLSGGSLTGRKSVTEDLLYENLTTDPRMHFVVQKGDPGAVHVTISSVVGGTAKVVHRLNLGRSPAAGVGDTKRGRVSRVAFMGATPSALPRVDRRKLVLAFYYPWYSSYHKPKMADHPRDPRNPYSLAGEESMTAQAAAHGIDGFISTWAGKRADGRTFRLALHAAEDHHQLITGYLESVMATQRLLSGQKAELGWLVQLLHYSNSKSFLKAPDGVPVVFVYRMDEFTPGAWQLMLAKLQSQYHLQVHLVGDDESATYLPYEWGIHSYGATGSARNLRNYSIGSGLLTKAVAALHAHAAKKLYAATVSPGYDDRRLRGGAHPVIRRHHGRRYAQTWRAALAGQPDWVLISSWNEWFEGTAIEPSKKYGGRALKQTRHQSRAWKRSS
jgi:hypothetical protein